MLGVLLKPFKKWKEEREAVKYSQAVALTGLELLLYPRGNLILDFSYGSPYDFYLLEGYADRWWEHITRTANETRELIEKDFKRVEEFVEEWDFNEVFGRFYEFKLPMRNRYVEKYLEGVRAPSRVKDQLFKLYEKKGYWLSGFWNYPSKIDGKEYKPMELYPSIYNPTFIELSREFDKMIAPAPFKGRRFYLYPYSIYADYSRKYEYMLRVDIVEKAEKGELLLDPIFGGATLFFIDGVPSASLNRFAINAILSYLGAYISLALEGKEKDQERMAKLEEKVKNFANVVYYFGIEIDLSNRIWENLPRDKEAIKELAGVFLEWVGDTLFEVTKNRLKFYRWGGKPIWAEHFELYEEYKWDEKKFFREREEFFKEMLETKEKFEQLLLKFYEKTVKDFQNALEENKEDEMEIWLRYMSYLLNPQYIATDQNGTIYEYYMQPRFEPLPYYSTREKVIEKTREQPPLVRELLKNPTMFKALAPRFGIELEKGNKKGK